MATGASDATHVTRREKRMGANGSAVERMTPNMCHRLANMLVKSEMTSSSDSECRTATDQCLDVKWGTDARW